jgi:hypothetical protein
MLGAEDRLADGQGTPVERLGLAVAAGGLVEPGGIVEGLGGLGGLEAARRLPYDRGAPVQRLGFGPSRASVVVESHLVEGRRRRLEASPEPLGRFRRCKDIRQKHRDRRPVRMVGRRIG